MSVKKLERKFHDLIDTEDHIKCIVYNYKQFDLLGALNLLAQKRIQAGKEYANAFLNIEVTFEEVKPLNPKPMSLNIILKKIDSLQMAIECIEVLITEYDDTYLQPTFNYLKEKKQLTAQQLATYTHNIDVQAEEITRLSHI